MVNIFRSWVHASGKAFKHTPRAVRLQAVTGTDSLLSLLIAACNIGSSHWKPVTCVHVLSYNYVLFKKLKRIVT